MAYSLGVAMDAAGQILLLLEMLEMLWSAQPGESISFPHRVRLPCQPP
jgi:hypothetical protein